MNRVFQEKALVINLQLTSRQVDDIEYQQSNVSENLVGDLYSTLFMRQEAFESIVIDFLSTPYPDLAGLLVALSILVQCVKHKAPRLLLLLDRDFLLVHLADLFADEKHCQVTIYPVKTLSGQKVSFLVEFRCKQTVPRLQANQKYLF